MVACSGYALCSPATVELPPGITPGTIWTGVEDGDITPEEEMDTWLTVKSALSTVRIEGVDAVFEAWKLLSPLYAKE
jgi:hypothetical protein